ncbi:MAG: MFS transporter [Firmicutes bacterium]|nr:MFS transporter [Bacillota bacterium]
MPGRPAPNWVLAIATMFFADVILWADRSNFAIAVTVWHRTLHWGPALIGIMSSAFTLGYLLNQPFGGIIADRAGPQRVIGISIGGWSLFTALTPVAPTLLTLTGVIRVLVGIFEAPYILATTSLIARVVGSTAHRGKQLAFVQSGASLGPAAGTVFGALLAKAVGVPAMFVVFGGAGVLVALFWWQYTRSHAPFSWAGTAELDDAARAEIRRRADESDVPLRILLRNGRLWAFMVSYFALPYCQYLFLTWLPVYFNQYRHIPLVESGVLSALPFVVAFFAAISAGWVSDGLARRGYTRGGWHRKALIMAGASTYVVTILIATFSASTALVVAMIVVANAALQFFVQPYFMIVSDISAKQAGTIAGFMQFWGILGALLAPIITGFLVQATHQFVLPFLLAAAVMAAAGLTVGVFVRVRPIAELVPPPPRSSAMLS